MLLKIRHDRPYVGANGERKNKKKQEKKKTQQFQVVTRVYQ